MTALEIPHTGAKVECLLHRRLWAVLQLLAEQEHLPVDRMASVLLAEALRQSLQGNIAFPVFHLPLAEDKKP